VQVIDKEIAGKVLRLVAGLEDLEDVQNVYANYDVSDEVMEKVG
jgi:transcriptional/translational regulatory protein YebC/TACO1